MLKLLMVGNINKYAVLPVMLFIPKFMKICNLDKKLLMEQMQICNDTTCTYVVTKCLKRVFCNMKSYSAKILIF
jgi:hypothetical protein